MVRLIYNSKTSFHLKDEEEVIPLHLHEELENGTGIQFNGKVIYFHQDETIRFIEKFVVPRLIS